MDILLALMEQESPSNSQLHGDENPYSPPHVPHSSDQSDDITLPPKRPWIQNELITLYESEKDIIESGDCHFVSGPSLHMAYYHMP